MYSFRLYPLIIRAVRARLSSDRHDKVEDSFIKIFRWYDEWRQNERLKSFLITVDAVTEVE